MCGDLSPRPAPPAGPAARMAMGLVRLYQVTLSPWLGTTCCYVPTCSAYAMESIRRFGALRGGWLALRRIGRCHPWAAAGADPVPRDYVWWGHD